MFDTVEKDKTFQYSTEFGLYKYNSDNNYTFKKDEKIKFGFHYFTILMTSIIILLGVLVLAYNYICDPNKSRKYINSTETSLVNINDVNRNITLAPYININNNTEPIASEFKNVKRKSDEPRPFLYEIRDPKPMGFQYSTAKDHKYEAQNINPQRYRGKNIQEIIKLLEQSQDGTNNKKFKKMPKQQTFVQDPFFPYKPQNPSDINLLATSRFRFAPAVQIEIKKPPKNDQEYPKYEKPLTQEEISLTLDIQKNQQYTSDKRHKLQNLYNQNTYFNNPNRFQQNKVQPYWNRHKWFPQRDRINNNNNFIAGPPPMIVHLNLYPKKKKKHNDQHISGSNVQQNCTDWNDDNYQIKNASEFNHLLEKVRHSFLDHSNDKVTINNHDKVNEFKYLPTDKEYPNVEIQKSIGFTIVNSNISSNNLENTNSQWRPMVYNYQQNNLHDISNHGNIQTNSYDLEVGEANETNENDNQDNESITLPLPDDIFQKYFNTKPTTPYKHEWNLEIVKKNPNLINHKPVYENGRDE